MKDGWGMVEIIVVLSGINRSRAGVSESNNIFPI